MTNKNESVNDIYFLSDLMARGMLKRPSRTMRGKFVSLEQKYEFLMSLCKKDALVAGGPAEEMFNVRGMKNLMWLDIDCRNKRMIDRWIVSANFPFPAGSFKLISSTTGRFHMYIATDRPLEIDECISMYEIIIRSASEKVLIREIDRVYGPDHYMNVFIPYASTGNPILPQELMQDVHIQYVLPDLEKIVYSEWSSRKKELRERMIGKDSE